MTNPNYLQADVANVLADIDALLSAYPELAEDEQLKADMLEGETDAFSVLSRLVNIEREANTMADAIAARVRDLTGRKARTEKRKEMARALMLRVMQATGIQKAPLVEATVSVSKGRDSVEVTDPDALPDEYVRVERTPDKKLLAAALANDNVPGARLKAGELTISVRAA